MPEVRAAGAGRRARVGNANGQMVGLCCASPRLRAVLIEMVGGAPDPIQKGVSR